MNDLTDDCGCERYYCKKCDTLVGPEDTMSPVMSGFTSVKVHIVCMQVVTKIDPNE